MHFALDFHGVQQDCGLWGQYSLQTLHTHVCLCIRVFVSFSAEHDCMSWVVSFPLLAYSSFMLNEYTCV